MLSVELVIKAVLGCFCFLAAFITVGHFVFKMMKRAVAGGALEVFFWEAVTGLLLFVSLYAIVVTQAKTILLPVPVLTLLLVRQFPALKQSMPFRFDKFSLLFIAGAVLIYLTYYLQAFVSFDDGFIRFASGDHTFYARVAEYVNQIGVESSNLEYLVKEKIHPTPYHYMDIWLTGLINRFLFIKSEFALMLVMYPLLATIGVIGLAGLLEKKFGYKNKYTLLIALVGLFFSGFAIFFPSFLLQADIYSQATVASPKTLLVAFFLIGSFCLVMDRRYLALSLLIAIAGLTFINILPTLMFAVFLFFVICKILEDVSWKQILWSLLILLSTIIFIGVFYFLQSSKGGSSLNNNKGLVEAINIQTLKTTVNILIGGSFQFLVLTPFIFLLIWALSANAFGLPWLKAQIKNPFILWIGILFISGLLVWSALHFVTTEAVQFFSNIFSPLIAISVSLLLYWILAFQKQRLLKLATMLLIFVMIAYGWKFDFHMDRISISDFSALKKFLPENDSFIFLNYKSNQEFDSFSSKNTRVYHPLPIINYFYEPYINESLNTISILQNESHRLSNAEEALLRNSSFANFYQQHGYQDFPATYEQAMTKFIKSTGAKYITVSKKATLPSVVQALMVDSLSLDSWIIYRIK